MDKTYVEYHDGVYYLANTCVTFDSLVYAYREGHSPETIAQAFWLDHEQVYGAITFYLAHWQEVDEYIRKGEAEQDALPRATPQSFPCVAPETCSGKAYQGSDSGSQVRFQADWNLNHIIVQAAQRREPTLDFQTAHAASLLGVSDSDVLGRAEREGWL